MATAHMKWSAVMRLLRKGLMTQAEAADLAGTSVYVIKEWAQRERIEHFGRAVSMGDRRRRAWLHRASVARSISDAMHAGYEFTAAGLPLRPSRQPQ